MLKGLKICLLNKYNILSARTIRAIKSLIHAVIDHLQQEIRAQEQKQAVQLLVHDVSNHLLQVIRAQEEQKDTT